MSQKNILSYEAIMHYEEEISKLKDINHELDKNILEIKNDVKEILSRLSKIDQLEQRVTALEASDKNRKRLIELFWSFCNFVYKARWFLIFIFMILFTVNIHFSIQNPQLYNYLVSKIPPIFTPSSNQKITNNT